MNPVPKLKFIEVNELCLLCFWTICCRELLAQWKTVEFLSLFWMYSTPWGLFNFRLGFKKSCPTIFKSIFPFEKKHNDFEARTERKNTFMTYHPLAIWVSISMLLWKVVLCHSISGWLSEGWFQCTHYKWTASSIAQPIWPYYYLSAWYLTFRNALLCKSYNFLCASYWHLRMVVAKSILSNMISWYDG